ncbi:MAG: hypothetical protein C0501_25470 [Isosphaera sp.]|nr:hypothetical protein [Isosphaera sp.]
MRIAALVFGLLGTAGSGYLGVKGAADLNDLRDLRRQWEYEQKVGRRPATEVDRGLAAEIDLLDRSAYPLIGGAAAGLVGCGLVLRRVGWAAGLAFAAGFAAPLALARDARPAVFTFELAVAAVLSFLVTRRTLYKKPRRRRDLSRDDDLVG